MPATQADLDALDAEIAKVRLVKSTTFADQSTTFRDVDDLLKLRALMQQEIQVAVTGSTTRYAATSKGL
jgi:hypothetical protein